MDFIRIRIKTLGEPSEEDEDLKRIKGRKLNVDENPRVAAEYGIMGIPTLLAFKEGKLVDRVVGAMSKSMLEARIRRFLYPLK